MYLSSQKRHFSALDIRPRSSLSRRTELMDSQTKRKVPTRKRKEDLLRDLFGEENPDLPSPQDRWINIQAVVREVYKELGREHGFIDKRWTEISPRLKVDLGNEVLSRLAEPDRVILSHRSDVVERLLKDHVSNRGDWKKEKARKRSQVQDRSSPQESLGWNTTPEVMDYDNRAIVSSTPTMLPPIATFDQEVERMAREQRPIEYPHASRYGYQGS